MCSDGSRANGARRTNGTTTAAQRGRHQQDRPHVPVWGYSTMGRAIPSLSADSPLGNGPSSALHYHGNITLTVTPVSQLHVGPGARRAYPTQREGQCRRCVEDGNQHNPAERHDRPERVLYNDRLDRVSEQVAFE